ncbi:MAG TPA: DUF559 domain-containing protein, partial [Candidatus Dormibacteraeota bacterium]|nr:DUF559 domain-containing protein [Candidatus Dormibacteraeota bacterium]
PEDRAEIDHIPVTALPLHLLEINGLIERSRGRHGLKPLRQALIAYSPEPVLRSRLEKLFRRRCREYGIETPQTNAVIGHIEVDALWPKQRLVVELASRAFHQTTEAFERDRERDAFLQLKGYRVIRITWRMLTKNPEATRRRLQALLTAPWS